jgi:uncharacterized protein (TIGR02145 family)
MNIYQSNGTNMSLPIATIDSMTFATSPPPTLNIYQYGGGIIIVVLANIDSITYTVTPNSNGFAVLSTLPLGNITNNSAVAGGNIVSDGGNPVTQRGVCWSTSPNPTTANSKTTDGSGIGNFSSSVNGLIANTTYYLRAYAINTNGTAYGNQLTFTTAGNPAGVITALNCNSATNIGTLTAGTAASGVSSSIPYTGGNGGAHNGQTVASTGVTGLTATLTAGNFASGTGTLTYTITGTPSAAGTANFALNIGGSSCTLTRTVGAAAGTITALNCNSATNSGILTAGASAIGVSSSIPYTGGNGGIYSAQSVNSTGVTGLTTNLAAGSFANGNDSLTFTITGTPANSGIASFTLNIGGQTCTLSRTVSVSGVIYNLSCIASLTGNLTVNTAANGVSFALVYNGSNGGTYNSQSVASAGVTGLTAALSAGTLNGGSGLLTYNITGTPNSIGTASFPINIGGQSCIFNCTVNALVGNLTALNCSGATNNGSLTAGLATTCGVSSSVPYSGGNGGSYNAQSINSTGVTGLTATLAAGSFANGSGSLTYTITGTPNAAGTANFALNIGGQNCTLSFSVNALATFMSHPGSGVTFNGYTYSSILLGNGQEWMAENLRTTNYRNGDPIPNVTNNTQWGNLTAGAWAHYNNNTLNENPYGKLYNWYAVADPRNVCPLGWHVPSDADWSTFTNYLDPNSANSVNYCANTAGGMMKSTGTQYWQSPNTGATNQSGFLGLPGGWRNYYNGGGFTTGAFYDIGAAAWWWSSTQDSSNTAWYRGLYYLNGSAIRDNNGVNKAAGFSVRCVRDSAGSIVTLNCGSATNNGNLIAYNNASGVTSIVPYTGGNAYTGNNSGTHTGQTVNSTGVTGLTATLLAGSFANGNGSLTYTITGTPSAAGTANFALNIGGKSCILSRSVNLPLGYITDLNCVGATNNGTLTANISASGVSSVVPYTGGNGGTHNGQTVSSTGVTGLTATLSAGIFANGAGTLTYTISGTPDTTGIANFALNIGGDTCTLSREVVFGCGSVTSVVDVTNPTTGKIWMDRNLGAAQVAASSTDTSSYGELYQWGRAADGHQCRTSATTSTLSSIDQPSHGNFIAAYNFQSPFDWRSPQNNNLWQGVNGVNNPCPSGYRIPTEAELDAERTSWSSNDAAGAFASPLKLPLAGWRDWGYGSLSALGAHGRYWSSTVSSTNSSILYYTSSSASITAANRANGYSVRCIKYIAGALGSLNCNGATNIGTLTVGTSSSGVSSSVSYTGGNGGPHSGQTVQSTGVIGLTATLNPGNFTVGSGSLTYTITGTPSSSGTASFALNIGGQTCVLTRTVNNLPIGSITALNCVSATNIGTLTQGLVASSVTSTVPYSGGNGGTHNGQTVNSTGVTGLIATLVAGTFANGSGSLTYTITGTPSTAGTASFALNIGGQTCTINRTVNLPIGSINSLNCATSINNGTLYSGLAANSVNSVIEYTGGNGGTHNGQSVASTGVTGLTATLVAGIFANGSGTLTYTITGIPSAVGTASFALNIGGQACTLNYSCVPVLCNGQTVTLDVTNPTTGKIWMDRNLGAVQVAISSTDTNSFGDLYQWGRISDGHQCRTSPTTSSLSSTDQPGHGNFILNGYLPFDWRSPQNTNLWQGVNGVNNPCPSGYRIPTEAELNTERTSWSSNNAAGAFASPLKLPMAGSRVHDSGLIEFAGAVGRYYSSTVSSTISRILVFSSGPSPASISNESRARGNSVRCIKN